MKDGSTSLYFALLMLGFDMHGVLITQKAICVFGYSVSGVMAAWVIWRKTCCA